MLQLIIGIIIGICIVLNFNKICYTITALIMWSNWNTFKETLIRIWKI